MGLNMTEKKELQFSLLDLAVFLAENWIAVFLLPLALAAVTFFAIDQRPRDYQASASILLPSVDNLEPTSPTYAAVSRLIFFAERMDTEELLVTIGRGRLDIEATERSSLQAEASIRGALNRLLDVVDQTLTAHLERIEVIEGHLKRLDAALDDPDAIEVSAEALATSSTIRSQIDADTRDLETLQAFAMTLQYAQISSGPLGRSPLEYAILMLFASSLASLAICSLWAGWSSAKKDPAAREKIARIRNAFLLRKA